MIYSQNFVLNLQVCFCQNRIEFELAIGTGPFWNEVRAFSRINYILIDKRFFVNDVTIPFWAAGSFLPVLDNWPAFGQFRATGQLLGSFGQL